MCNKQPRFNGSLTRCTIIPVLRKKTRLRPLCNHETAIYILVVLKWFLGICVIKTILGKCMFWLWHISRHCCISTNQLVCTHYVNSHNWNHIRIETCKTFNQIASTYFVNLQKLHHIKSYMKNENEDHKIKLNTYLSSYFTPSNLSGMTSGISILALLGKSTSCCGIHNTAHWHYDGSIEATNLFSPREALKISRYHVNYCVNLNIHVNCIRRILYWVRALSCFVVIYQQPMLATGPLYWHRYRCSIIIPVPDVFAPQLSTARHNYPT